jgi:serine/threonine protein kinase
MNPELEQLAKQLAQATKPEDVFGGVADENSLRKRYHSMAKIAHPDVHPIREDKLLAQVTFNQLVEWFNRAAGKLHSGSYGEKERIVLATARREYEIDEQFEQDETFNFYACRFVEDGRKHQAVIRIVRDPRRNNLSTNEARILDSLRSSRDASKFQPYLPNLLDTFLYDDGRYSRHAAVFEACNGWYSLEEVCRAYPHGIDPKDMAWMWRRLLAVLGFAHANSVIHGAVLPDNVWVHPEQHGLMLRNWFVSVQDGEPISKLDAPPAGWYSQEDINRGIPTHGMDINMSAKCMIYLLGGDAERRTIPDSVPHAMRAFLRGSSLPGKRAPQNAWAVRQDFDDLLQRLWGERKFHPFTMSIPH